MSKVYVTECGLVLQMSKYVKIRMEGDPLFTTRLNLEAPEAVTQTHLDFFKHGSDIIHTNTYQSSLEGFKKYLGFDATQSLNLVQKAVKLAQTAREKFMKENPGAERPRIAGCIAPYGAHLNDGSEYTGAYIDKISLEKLKEWHRWGIAAVIDAGVDLVTFDTQPCLVRKFCLEFKTLS